MVDNTKAIKSTSSTQASSADALSGFVGSKKSEQVSKDQFLQLLVTQLKNQDPLDPMKSEEFAVNLAQFSQLEQLVSINDKMGAQGTDLSSMAAYLGNEVSLNKDKVTVEGGNGGLLRVDMPRDAESLEIELTDAQGRVAEVVRTGEVKKGRQTVDMSKLTVGNGDYAVKVTASSATAGSFGVSARPAGVVTGFIPGPDPRLIVNGREIAPADVVEVATIAAS